MGTLNRYVLLEVLRTFLLTMIILTLFLTIVGGVRKGLKAGLSPVLIIQVFPYVLPEMLLFTIPGALLVAVTTVFGRLSAANELVALKSLGVHPMSVIWPVLGLASVLSLTNWWLFDVNAWWCRPQLQRVILEAAQEIIYGTLAADRSFCAQGMSIVVRDVKDRTLIEPVITVDSRGRLPRVTVTAAEARLEIDPQGSNMTLTCRNGEIGFGGQHRLHFEDTFRQDVPFDAPSRGGHSLTKASSLPTAVLAAAAEAQAKEIESLQHQLQTCQASAELAESSHRVVGAETLQEISRNQGVSSRERFFSSDRQPPGQELVAGSGSFDGQSGQGQLSSGQLSSGQLSSGQLDRSKDAREGDRQPWAAQVGSLAGGGQLDRGVGSKSSQEFAQVQVATFQKRLRQARLRLAKLRLEPHRRWSNGFTSLCFALIGIPMAILGRNQSFVASLFSCMLPILVVYYPLLVIGERSALGGFPPQSVWLADLVFLGLGLILLRRAVRY